MSATTPTPTPNPEPVYRPTSVLITGGAGFIGSHVLCKLVERYPEVKFVCLDALTNCSNIRNMATVESKPNFTFVKGDIRSLDLVSLILRTYKIDTIMNFAAESHVDLSFGNAVQFTKTNVVGTHVLLECARLHGIRRFLHVSTDEVYGEVFEERGVTEENGKLQPNNPYSCSKAAAEFICQAYMRSFSLPVIITRGNNVYGPRQYPEKVIPKFVLRLMRNQKCCVHGDGSARRNFLHVDDCAEAFDVVLHYGKDNEIYNIGIEEEYTVLELANRIIREMNMVPPGGSEDAMIEYVGDRLYQDARYAINSEKLHKLGWKPRIDFDTGLRDTIQWYRDNANHWASIDAALQPYSTDCDHAVIIEPETLSSACSPRPAAKNNNNSNATSSLNNIGLAAAALLTAATDAIGPSS